jgi:hypothetical protein
MPCRLSTGPGPIRKDGTVRWRSRQGGNTSRHEKLVTALEAAGFWAGLPSRDGARLGDEAAQGASPVTGLAERGWLADGADLAEGDVEELRRSMRSLRLRPCSSGDALAADPWMDCTVKPLGLANRLLDEAGSSDRVALFCPGGNDGLAVQLLLVAIQVLAESELIPEQDRPVVPSAVT